MQDYWSRPSDLYISAIMPSKWELDPYSDSPNPLREAPGLVHQMQDYLALMQRVGRRVVLPLSFISSGNKRE